MIILKSPSEIEIMAQANRIVAGVLLKLKNNISPGVTTDELDAIARKEIISKGATPTFIGYPGNPPYPKTLCTSINEEVVHGIPGPRKLKEGDIIGVDCGVTYQGFVADAAFTMGVGQINEEAAKLIKVTEECLYIGIDQVRVGNRIGDIGAKVQAHAESAGYSIVRDFVGHGVGRKMHEEPQVPNFGRKGEGPRIKVGMVLAIEPMLNIGGPDVKILKDGWTVRTVDGSLSAHFEHSVAVTEDGPRILSQL